MEGRISKLPLDKGNKLKEGHGGLLRERILSCVGGRGKEENECVRKRLVLTCAKVLFMKKMCARNKHGRKLCVASTCSGVHGRISMTKPPEF